MRLNLSKTATQFSRNLTMFSFEYGAASYKAHLHALVDGLILDSITSHQLFIPLIFTSSTHDDSTLGK